MFEKKVTISKGSPRVEAPVADVVEAIANELGIYLEKKDGKVRAISVAPSQPRQELPMITARVANKNLDSLHGPFQFSFVSGIEAILDALKMEFVVEPVPDWPTLRDDIAPVYSLKAVKKPTAAKK